MPSPLLQASPELSDRALAATLAEALRDREPAAAVAIGALRRLSGGANMETWYFELLRAGRSQPLILRRRPAGMSQDCAQLQGLPLASEAALLSLARRVGVPVPGVVAGFAPDAPLGEALVLSCVSGEALPQRLLREERFASARERLAFQCGEALARIHSVAFEDLPGGLRDLDWTQDLDRLQALCDQFGNVSPAQQLALNWLRKQAPPQSRRVLCHGDFRLGNLMVNEDGLAAVLDWELAHIGYAGEDLGYLCAQVWRFGGSEPVGGFGGYRQLLDGYRSVSFAAPLLEELKLWELYAALGWGLVCLTMQALHEDGIDPGLERAAVGRRFGESEVDILRLLDELPA